MSAHYQPLQRDRAQIRLLRLQPSQAASNSEVTPECSIFVVNLDDSPKTCFNALSYTWGPPDPSGSILINGQEFRVRQNLLEFLRFAINDLAICGDPIWIDQICIDQSSTEERNHQVSLMSKVYGQAWEVLIWLGHEAESSHGPQLWNRRSVTLLLSRQYWRRLWMIQEVLLARSLTILYGRIKITWQELVEHVQRNGIDDALKHSWGPRGHDYRNMHCALKLIQLRPFSSPVTQLPLGKLVRVFCFSECADHRDKVFGLSALLSETERIQIDYNTPILQLFFQVVSKLGSEHTHLLVRGIAESLFTGEIEAKKLRRAEVHTLAGFVRGEIVLYDLLETHLKGIDPKIRELCREIPSSCKEVKNMCVWWSINETNVMELRQKRDIARKIRLRRTEIGTWSMYVWKRNRGDVLNYFNGPVHNTQKMRPRFWRGDIFIPFIEGKSETKAIGNFS